jgi:ATP-dependent Lon protease
MATSTSEKKYNTRSSSKKMNSKSEKTCDSKRKYKSNMSSDEEDISDSDSSYHIESESEYSSDSEFIASEDEKKKGNVMAEKDYQKFLYGLFPSKYLQDKINKSSTPIKHKKITNKCCPPAPKKKRRHISDNEDEENDEIHSESLHHKGKPSNFNIAFIIDDGSQKFLDKNSLYNENDYSEEDNNEDYTEDDDENDEDYDENDVDENDVDEDYTDDEDDEDNDEDDDEDDDDEDDEYENSEQLCLDTECGHNDKAIKKNSKTPKNKKTDVNIITDDVALNKMKDMINSLTSQEKRSPAMKGFITKFKNSEKVYLKNKEKESKKQKKKNTKKLKSLFREKDIMNDLKFFHEKMSLQEQQSVLNQIELIHKNSYIDKPYRLSLLDADIPVQYKACAYRKISSLRYMEPGGGEYYKMKNWVDTFMQIPFNKYKNLPITLEDGVEKCHEFMDNAKKILDQAVYGLNDAKLQIMQMIGQWIVNPSAIGSAIAIKGPMGTGKTTLVKEGISKILGRDFAFIALGGATDSSFLEGHSYTYEGSSWGKIVDLLIKCKSMNPVIYFDELDKISDTPKGEEIVGILTHLTDTSQNSQFHDRYFSDIDFDLSRCLFIFSYNDESKVNRILLDRMYRIQTKGYDQAQKTTIANNYLMPKICEQVKFKTDDIVISENTMHYIITNYTDKEDGVRTLKRCLEIIHTKLNLYRLMKPDTNIFENEMSIKVEFPMHVTDSIVDKLIKKDIDNGAWKNMYT